MCRSPGGETRKRLISGLTASSSLQDWLRWQESAHSKSIDLGLDRVTSVYRRLACAQNPKPVTITVAGTNGKGSCVAMLEAIYLAAGYRTGVYSTPHLLSYNERIKIQQTPVSDALLCEVFATIDQARDGVSLSYFEFGTLAALELFSQASVDVQILEVGLGGRLDAVNLIDADGALITTIDLDHAAWLGTDRSVIATEKAGVFRADQAAVCADPTVPISLIEHAACLGARLTCAGRDFSSDAVDATYWRLVSPDPSGGRYPQPALFGAHQIQNAAGVVQLVTAMQSMLPVERLAIEQGLKSVQLSGRLQRVGQRPDFWIDVAHNPQSACALADFLNAQHVSGKTHAVFGMMADKDLENIVEPLLDRVDAWYLTDLDVARAAAAVDLAKALAPRAQGKPVISFDNPRSAITYARNQAQASDCIIAFGSFYLAEACLRAL